MAKKQPAKKYPLVPPTNGARTQHATEIVRLEVGGDPYVAPRDERDRVAQAARYWGKELRRRFTVRRYGEDCVTWRLA